MKNSKNYTAKFVQRRRHPIGRRLLAGLLCICLSLVPLPLDDFGYFVQAAQKQEITSFVQLPEDVGSRTVPMGTDLESLNLPQTLEAVCPKQEMPQTTGEDVVIIKEDISEEKTEGAGKNIETSSEETASPGEETAPLGEEPSISEGQPVFLQEKTDVEQTETLTIEGVTWISEPEYNKEAEGSYVFTPVIPDVYVLAAGVELPQITIMVVREGLAEEEGNFEPDREQRDIKNIEKDTFLEVQEEKIMPLTEPGCGTISEDTVWSGNVTLSNGELIVEPGVTLTIQGVVTIQGNVTIKGGGTIKRGNGKAYFKAWDGVHLTVGNVTLDGAMLPASYSMIETVKSNVILDDGCKIHNCRQTVSETRVEYTDGYGHTVTGASSGAAIFVQSGTAEFNNITIENNSLETGGGGSVFIRNSVLRINGGIYKNNKTTMRFMYGGGCIYNALSKLYIYDGKFIGNFSAGSGGCIVNINHPGTETYLYGGEFEGNRSSYPGYAGSGGIMYLAYDPARPGLNGEHSVLDLSGNVKFCGDGIQNSGTDGIYLDLSPDKTIARKIRISDTLRYPVTLYLKASEGYVLAEGTNEYRLLHERDMKKINFVDVGNSGKTWYAVLDKEKNEVYLSETNPNYGYYVYYISNGAQGTVADDNTYQINDTAKVQSADDLQREGYTFKEWNTKADGTGTSYQPGEEFTIEGDTDLYAIFAKGKVLKADFYSGGAGQKQTKTLELAEGTDSGNVTAPDLEEMEGWHPLGWSETLTGYDAVIEPGEEISLTEDKEYYGIYEKDVTLTYRAEHADIAPEDATAKRFANVHEEVSTTPAQFVVAPAAVRYGYAFAGWNTETDSTGRTYKEGDAIETETDMTLYAIFKRPLHAYFHSGSAGQVEERVVEIPEDATTGTTRTQELKPFGTAGSVESAQDAAGKGWQPVGWDLQADSYDGEIQAGEEVTLTDDTDFYGVYQKGVTLSYDENGGETCPQAETKECRANVHEEVSYEIPKFTAAAAITQSGYVFAGWNTKKDGTGKPFEAGKMYALDEDTTLYAQWETDTVAYRVEHYKQDVEGDGYTREDADTERITGRAGAEVEAEANPYTGFSENKKHVLRCASGIVKADGSLVLKLYYDRNIYHVDFDLNGGNGNLPDSQDIRYGGLLQTVAAPKRAGYNFKGWYLDRKGSQGKQWDFARTAETNTSSQNVTLYAKWADETAPILGKTTYGKGHKDLFGWILHRNRLKITVPIKEEGSGVKQAEYVLIPEGGEEKETEDAAYIRSADMVYGAIGLPLGAVNAGGKKSRSTKGRARVTTRNGNAVAEFTISEDFKGTVAMTASDWAGNVSAQKMLTADGNGIIVEDNAPDIRFIPDDRGQYDNISVIGVEVRDNAGENISGGIAEVSCRVDKGKEVSVPDKRFHRDIVEYSKFTVKVSGSGTHILYVDATDNAGNKTSRQFSVDIRGKETVQLPKPGTGTEPKTGDGSHVEIYATVSMIAGFSYLLLYFREHGMTEEKKEELVLRLVRWAKGKGGIRKLAALALIFLLLAYYQSVGKTVEGKWEEACQQ